MERALRETDRRREKQRAYNEVHRITPTTIKRNIGDIIAHVASKDALTIALADDKPDPMAGHNPGTAHADLEHKLHHAAPKLYKRHLGQQMDSKSTLPRPP